MGKRRRHSSSDHDIGPSVKQTASDTYTQREPDSPVYSELDSSSDSSSSSSSDSSYQRKKLKKKKHAKKHKSRHSDSSQHSRKKMKKKEKKKKKKKKKKSSKSDTCRTVEAESAPGPLPAGGAIDQSTVSKSLAASSSSSANIPETAAGRRLQAPMSKAEWEKQQSIVRRVYDPTTGRDRLVKGDGEILEEIVSKGRHKQINKQATLGDGLYYQSQAQLHR